MNAKYSDFSQISVKIMPKLFSLTELSYLCRLEKLHAAYGT